MPYTFIKVTLHACRKVFIFYMHEITSSYTKYFYGYHIKED